MVFAFCAEHKNEEARWNERITIDFMFADIYQYFLFLMLFRFISCFLKYQRFFEASFVCFFFSVWHHAVLAKSRPFFLLLKGSSEKWFTWHLILWHFCCLLLLRCAHLQQGNLCKYFSHVHMFGCFKIPSSIKGHIL